MDSDLLNRATNLVDAAGATKYAYTAGGQLWTEDGPWSNDTVTNIYYSRLRTNLSLAQPTSQWTNAFAYDAAKRLTGVTSPAAAFGYPFVGPVSRRSQKLSLPNTSYLTNTYDNAARLTGTWLKNRSKMMSWWNPDRITVSKAIGCAPQKMDHDVHGSGIRKARGNGLNGEPNKLTAGLLLLLLFLLGCRPVESSKEWKEQQHRLNQLVASRANRERIEAELGPSQFYYQKGSTNWVALDSFIAREKRSDIREHVGECSKVMYYTTEHVMTWICLDDKEQVISYYLCGQ